MLIGEKDRAVIRELLEEMTDPVRLVVFTEGAIRPAGHEPCPYCEQTVTLARELAELSDRLSVEVVNFHQDKAKVEEYGIARIPAIAVVGDRDYGVRYYGIPAGWEFRTLLESIIDVSRGTTDLPEDIREQVARIDSPVHIQVFVTPTCPYCPAAVRFAHKLAVESDYVTADMVEAQEFPALARRYDVFGVPRTVINETTHIEGALPEAYAILHVLKAAGKLTEEEESRLAAIAR